MMLAKCVRPLPLVLALQAVFSSCVYAQAFTINNGEEKTDPRILLNAIGDINQGGSLIVQSASSNPGIAIRGTSTINNTGVINQIGTGRAIDADTAGAIVTINNNIGGAIKGSGAQVIRIDKASVKFEINNQGTIAWVGSASVGGERAIKADLNFSSQGNQIINGSTTNKAAVISSAGDDALRLGSNVTLTNYGTIVSTGSVNTSCPGYIGDANCNASPTDSTKPPAAADGVAIENDRTNVTIVNYGSITGPRHGIDGGKPKAGEVTADPSLLNLKTLTLKEIDANGALFTRVGSDGTESEVRIKNAVIINYEGGTIIGNNGSGVGLDNHGVVINHGTISGKYAGTGNVFNQSKPGFESTSSNGDGDGVDIDGVAYIENYGRIEGLGAGGKDSGGEDNGADGIAAGGGTIINHVNASIYGDSKGILIDDGSDGRAIAAQRGTAITQGAAAIIDNAGSIIGNKEAAIGLLGNFDDHILNRETGVIIGGAETELLGKATNTTPSLSGAAVQMGAGDDVLENYGRIEGKNGLAIDMGSGNDTLRLFGGTVIGTIDGGTGTNLLETNGTQVFEAGKISNFQNLAVKGGTTTFNYALNSFNNVVVDDGGKLRVNGSFSTANDLSVGGTLLAPTGNTFRTINVAGNYSQSADGILEARIGANGASDQLIVVGNANLADGAKIRAIATSYVEDGTHYTLIDAGTLTATAGNLNLTSVNGNSNFVTYTLQRNGEDLILIAHREKSLADVLPVADKNAATGLQTILSTGSAASQSLLNAIENLSSTQAVSRATRQLMPETNGSQQQAASAAQGSLFSAFDSRSDAARGGESAALNGQTGMSSGDGNRGRIWMQGLAAFAKQKERKGANGYDVDAQGLAVGYEVDLDGRDLIGVSGGYTQAGTDGRNAGVGNDNNVKALHVGGYFSRTEAFYTLDASVAVSANRYNAQRAVNIGGFSETLRGKFDGTQLGARFEYGLPFQIDSKWSGRWIMGARLARLDNGAYTESGGVSAQNIGSTQSNSAQSVLGAELRNRIDNTASVSLRARWLHEFADTPGVTASYVVGGPAFQVDGVQPGRNALLLGTSYRKTTASGTVISVGYDMETRSRYLGHQLTARAMWSF